MSRQNFVSRRQCQRAAFAQEMFENQLDDRMFHGEEIARRDAFFRLRFGVFRGDVDAKFSKKFSSNFVRRPERKNTIRFTLVLIFHQHELERVRMLNQKTEILRRRNS